MKKRYIMLGIALACAVLLGGCGNRPEVSEPDYSALIQPPVDVNITDCVTAEELAVIMGCPMELLGVYEENSQALFISEDSTHQVMVHMLNQTLAGFEAMKNASTSEMVWQEGLGEAAYWYGDASQLMFYSGGYAVDVAVTGTDDGSQHKAYAQQIAETILRKLPQRAE